MRSVSQISPAVAHDLRAPINAMVFNIEILKEMLASGRATDPANKDKLLRYVNVLKEELSRLHRGMENFLAYISPRGDRDETLDLRELAEELAALLVAPARKQQARVETELPASRCRWTATAICCGRRSSTSRSPPWPACPGRGRSTCSWSAQDGRARLRLYGVAGARTARRSAGSAPPEPRSRRPGSTSAFRRAARSPSSGWRARSSPLYGGEARAAGPEGALPGAPQAYEVELTISENPGNGNKGVS